MANDVQGFNFTDTPTLAWTLTADDPVAGVQKVEATVLTSGGSAWYNGSGSPSALHNDGDFYLDQSTGEVWKQVSGAWADQGFALGGTAFHNGSGAPSSALGSSNDYYLDDATGDIYVKDPVVAGYASAVAGSSPVAYYRTEETSGTSFADSSGNGITGTWEGGPTLGVAPDTGFAGIEKSVTFDGNTAKRGRVPDNTLIDITGDHTYEAWIKPSVVSTQGFFMGKAYDNAGHEATIFGMSSSGKLEVSRVFAGSAILAGATTLTANVWQHAVMTRAGNVWTLYRNGVQDAQATVAFTVPVQADRRMLIGAYGYSDGSSYSNPWNGGVTEAAFYNRALSSTEVANHYAQRNVASSGGWRKVFAGGLTVYKDGA